MGTELINLGIVISSLILIVIIPFIPVSYFLFRGQQWPKILFSAMVLGCSVQATVGLLWSHLLGKYPLAETAVFAIVWLLLAGWSLKQYAKASNDIVVNDLDEDPTHAGLILILCAGFVIRSIHPIEVAYLGQSDAYTHLNYIHNIATSGYLINPVYPPGFHWILALPSLLFSVDPYDIARFGGAFFGTGLVLGIYVMLDRCVGRQAALFGSFCAAGFPGMTLLMKTGVGVFANQFGLFLLPAVFMFYILTATNRSGRKSDSWLLLISLCGLAAAVPMILLHILIIIGLERFVMLLRTQRQWLRKTFQIALLIIPAVCLLTFHMTQVGGGQRYQTAQIMTGYGGEKPATVGKMADVIENKLNDNQLQGGKIVTLVTQSPYFKLVVDYVSIKRRGFGNIRLDAVGAVLAGFFLMLLFVGIIRQGTSQIVIGLWGLITSLQAGTGLLQFSSYQREGWSLLIATCCMCGIIAAAVYRFGQQSRLFRSGVWAVMAVSVLWCVMHPPVHFPIRSTGEDELIRAIRFLGRYGGGEEVYCRDNEQFLCPIQDQLSDSSKIVLVTRRFVGWGNQGEIARNVMPPDSAIPVLIVDNRDNQFIFESDRQYVVLVDKNKKLSAQHTLGAFAMVTPAMVQATLTTRHRLFKINDVILSQIKNLSDVQWDVDTIVLSDNLVAYIITPIQTS